MLHFNSSGFERKNYTTATRDRKMHTSFFCTNFLNTLMISVPEKPRLQLGCAIRPCPQQNTIKHGASDTPPPEFRRLNLHPLNLGYRLRVAMPLACNRFIPTGRSPRFLLSLLGWQFQDNHALVKGVRLLTKDSSSHIDSHGKR